MRERVVLASFPPSLSKLSSSSENVVMEMDFTLCGGFSPRLREKERGRREREREEEREEEAHERDPTT